MATPLHPAGQARTDALIARAKSSTPIRCAVVHPCDPESLKDALDAAAMDFIQPVLVGKRYRLQESAEKAGVDISAYGHITSEPTRCAA